MAFSLRPATAFHPLYPHPSSELRAARPLSVSRAAGGSDIPSEMGRFCSGRPEKSPGQRGEVMAAVSGVILPLHLRVPLSDSAFLFRSGEPGNTHLRRLPSCAASPRVAVQRVQAGDGARLPVLVVPRVGGHRWGSPMPAHPKSSELKHPEAGWASDTCRNSFYLFTCLLPKLAAPVSLKSPKPAAFHLLIHLNEIISLTWLLSRALGGENHCSTTGSSLAPGPNPWVGSEGRKGQDIACVSPG